MEIAFRLVRYVCYILGLNTRPGPYPTSSWGEYMSTFNHPDVFECRYVNSGVVFKWCVVYQKRREIFGRTRATPSRPSAALPPHSRLWIALATHQSCWYFFSSRWGLRPQTPVFPPGVQGSRLLRISIITYVCYTK